MRSPNSLAPDAQPIGDFRPMAEHRVNAKRGSDKLLAALLRMNRKRRRKRTKKQDYRFHTWETRQRNFERIEELQRIVAEHFDVPVISMTGHRGVQSLAEARQVAMYLAREVIGASYPDIGRCFDKDHTTVIHARNVTATRVDLAADIVILTEKLRG